MENIKEIIRCQIIILMAIAILLNCSFATLAKKKHSEMSYLINGVNKIYVVDESRCSTSDNKEDAGKVYIIEGTEKISKIQNEIEGWNPSNEFGLCACGGPDKHYYCYNGEEQITYWGVDCDTYLNNQKMPLALNAIINPKYDTYIGTPIGYALIADVPVEYSENDIITQACKSGLKIFFQKGDRKYVQREQVKWTAPFKVVLRTAVNGNEEDIDIRNNKKLSKSLDKVFKEWIEKEGLVTLMLSEDNKQKGISGPRSAVVNKTIYLSKLPDNIKMNVTYQVGDYSVLVEEIHQRTMEEQNKSHCYQATILVSTANSEEEAKKVSAAMPMLKNIKCICDRLI